MSKFKVGDEVEVVALEESMARCGGESNPSFKETLGEVGVVTDIWNGRISVRFTEGRFAEGYVFYYLSVDLKIFNRDKSEEKTMSEFILLKRNVVDSHLVMTEIPKVYNSLQAAKAAATQLACNNKGTKYSVLEVKGTVVSGDVVWS